MRPSEDVAKEAAEAVFKGQAARARIEASLVCFQLAGRRFACRITDVKETIVVKPLTRVFLTPPWVAGIINLRGDIVAVVDLAAFLSLGKTPIVAETRIVIARADGRAAGFLVERLDDTRAVDLGALEPAPAGVDAEVAALLSGVVTLPGGEPLAVLDLAKILRSPRLKVR
jgi:purine-binding chemotaxis protein CheW